MASKMATDKALTLTQARAIVKAFEVKASVNHARVTSLLAHTGKTATKIIDEIYLAYGDVDLPYAIGESTIQTALNVAKAWVSLPVSVRGKVDKADQVLIFDALVQVRRSNAKLPDGTIPKGVAVKRMLVGKTKYLTGGEAALAHVATALTKEADPTKWAAIAVGAHLCLHKSTLSVRRAGGRISATDEALPDVVRSHNDSAGDARTGDEKAEKRNGKATRKSKHERDPLEPAKPGNDEGLMPSADAGANAGNAKAPAKILALADADLAATMRHMRALIASGAKITPALDVAFTALSEAWEEAASSTTVTGKRVHKGATVGEIVKPSPAGPSADEVRAVAARANDAARKAREAVLTAA
jgi:hypothetical protein